MKKLIRFLLFAVLIFSIEIPSISVHADTNSCYVDDQAELFTAKETADLEHKMQKISDKYDCSIVILTVPDTNGTYSTNFINDYYDFMYDDNHKISEDCIIAFRDIDERILEIRAYGDMQKYLPWERCEKIIDEMAPDIMVDDYYEGFLTFIDCAGHYLHYPPNPLTWTLVQLLIALIVSTIIIFCLVHQSASKMTVNSNTYLDPSTSGVLAKRDIYYNTTVTRTRIQTNSSSGGSRRSSGGGSSHHSVSSRGHSSSGARRRI